MPRKSFDRSLDEHLHTLVSQGNHEAYQRLAKRYNNHSASLCREILTKYPKTPANFNDLMGICRNIFPLIVKKYDHGLSSFFSYWKEQSKQHIIDYLIDCDETADNVDLRFSFSLDDGFDNRHTFSDYLCEKDDDRYRRRLVFEIKNLIARNEKGFTRQELTLLRLIFEGYSILELEHTGLLKKSAIYLTFKSSVNKLKSLMLRNA